VDIIKHIVTDTPSIREPNFAIPNANALGPNSAPHFAILVRRRVISSTTTLWMSKVTPKLFLDSGVSNTISQVVCERLSINTILQISLLLKVCFRQSALIFLRLKTAGRILVI
jgi:hypothetical protein